MGKYQEFWIKEGEYEAAHPENFYSTVVSEWNDYYKEANLIHVIEKKAYNLAIDALKICSSQNKDNVATECLRQLGEIE